jgi:hypothetical protein
LKGDCFGDETTITKLTSAPLHLSLAMTKAREMA